MGSRMRGKFINIEGLDGCGKSTQVKLLARWLHSKGREVVITHEPTHGPVGRIIYNVIKGEFTVPVAFEALLFAADRLQHVEDVITPAVKSGKVVINSRYTPSSIAYQSARGIPVGWMRKINEMAPEPDLTILIDVPVEVSARRMNGSRKLDAFDRNLKLQRKVRQAYLDISGPYQMKVVDGNRSVDEVQVDIRELVGAML